MIYAYLGFRMFVLFDGDSWFIQFSNNIKMPVIMLDDTIYCEKHISRYYFKEILSDEQKKEFDKVASQYEIFKDIRR